MTRSTPGGVLVLALGLSAAAAAQDAPWTQAAVRGETQRVVAAARGVLVASEAGDPRPALRALQDRSWQLRLLGAVRLRTLGLDPRWVQALSEAASPEAAPPADDWPPLQAAREFVDGLQVPATPAPEISAQQAGETLVGLVAERLVEGPEPAAGKRAILEALLAYQTVLPPERRAWLGAAALTALDQAQLLRDLRRRELQGALADEGRAVFAWFARNQPYLYWQPRRRRFEVDLPARSAGEPSARYRVHTPWKPGEGPAPGGR